MPTVTKDVKAHKPLPAPNTDFYYLYETLPAEELAIVKRVREFMETKVEPVITDYWVRDEFPFELLPGGEGPGHRWRCHEGLWLRRRKSRALRLYPNGDRAHRPIVLDIPRRATRSAASV
jgi:hypothetical protein